MEDEPLPLPSPDAVSLPLSLHQPRPGCKGRTARQKTTLPHTHPPLTFWVRVSTSATALAVSQASPPRSADPPAAARAMTASRREQ